MEHRMAYASQIWIVNELNALNSVYHYFGTILELTCRQNHLNFFPFDERFKEYSAKVRFVIGGHFEEI